MARKAPLRAALASAVLGAIATVVLVATNGSEYRPIWPQLLFGTITSATLLTLTVGLLLHKLFYRAKWTWLWLYGSAGAMTGLAWSLAIAALIFSLSDETFSKLNIARPGVSALVLDAVRLMTTGGITGLLFWLLRRPDRDDLHLSDEFV